MGPSVPANIAKFFDRDTAHQASGRCGRASVIVLSGARPPWPHAFCDRDGGAPLGGLERGHLGRSALKLGWSMGRAFFDRDSSGAVKLGDAAVLSAVLFLRAWTPARLLAGLARGALGGRSSAPQMGALGSRGREGAENKI